MNRKVMDRSLRSGLVLNHVRLTRDRYFYANYG